MAAAESLRFPLRTATYQAPVGLLAVTGMRVGEAIALDRAGADLDAGVLTVRNGKSRLVPVHETTARALRDYLRLRDRLCPDFHDVHLAGGDQAALLQRPRHLEENSPRMLAWCPRRALPGSGRCGTTMLPRAVHVATRRQPWSPRTRRPAGSWSS